MIIEFVIPGEVLKLKLREYYVTLNYSPYPRMKTYFALSAEEVPIEKLRLITNFVEHS